MLHHTSIIPAPSVLAVHHSQARESLGGLFFLTRGILFQDVAVGWLDNYIATASSITLRLAPAAILENVAPTSGPRLLALENVAPTSGPPVLPLGPWRR